MKTKSATAKSTNSNTMTGRFRAICARVRPRCSESFRSSRGARLLPLLLLLSAAAVKADQSGAFTYYNNGGLNIIITGYTGPGGKVVIPSLIVDLPVSQIWASSFMSCYTLTSVTVPDSVVNIGYEAFAGCTNLTSISIGKNVNFIGDSVFHNCPSLSEIKVDADNITYCSLDGVLFNKNQTTLILYPHGKTGSFAIPSSMTSIAGGTFEDCTGLTSVTIPGSVTNIEIAAFCNCPSLTSVTIPISVTSMGDRVFQYCTNLTSVTIPSGVTSIGIEMFYGCTKLTSVTIPNSITSIGDYMFYNCTSLASVTIPGSVTSIGNYAFEGCTNLTGVYFKGNAPSLGGSSVFTGDNKATVYYLTATTGWGSTFGGRPTALWAGPSTVATPIITPAGGTFTNSVKVTLGCATAGATIRYTTDGTEPTSASLIYKKTVFTLTTSLTLKAKAFKKNMADSDVATAAFTIIVPPPPIIATTSLTNATAKQTYTATLQVTDGTGVVPYKWSLATGSKLPAGLKLNAKTGVISGKPTKAGTFSFTVKVTDAKKQFDTQTLSLTVN